MTKIPFVPFVACTAVGVVPRLIILGLFGATIARFQKPALIALIVVVVLFGLFYCLRHRKK